MVVTNFADERIQQPHTTSKELTFQLYLCFWMDPLPWKGKLKLEIQRTKIRNWDWGRILKRKFFMENGISDCNIWNVVPKIMRVFIIISDYYIIKFTESVYESKLKTELGKVNLNMETGISKSVFAMLTTLVFRGWGNKSQTVT